MPQLPVLSGAQTVDNFGTTAGTSPGEGAAIRS